MTVASRAATQPVLQRLTQVLFFFGVVAAFSGAACAAGPAAAPERPAAPAPVDPAQALDRLYARLAKTRYPDEAAGILAEIDRARAQSGSDAADLLFSRASQARQADPTLALKLFDAVVALDPDWSEAYSERANARFQSGDVDGAMTDLAETLKRDPRDIGALGGLAAILLDSGRPDEALVAYDRALALAPAYQPLKEGRARAQTRLWGQSP